MDRRTLEHGLVRRLLAHIEQGTTDMADECMEVLCETYVSESRHEEELEVLFHNHPVVLCMSGALPRPNTYLAIEMCGTPLLLTRDRDGKVHCMLNACRHRGVKIADGKGDKGRFVCPFHAWTYDAKGALVGLPVANAFAGMCKEERGLIQLPVDEGHGVIAGRLRPGEPVRIDDYLGPLLAQELDLLQLGSWEPFSEPHVHPVSANWKVTLDTYRENYHFDVLHKSTLKDFAHGGVLTFDPLGKHLRNCSAVRTIGQLRELDEANWENVIEHFTFQYALFPNTSLTVGPRHLELWQILPVTSSTSEVLHTAYVRPDLAQEAKDKAASQIEWICKGVVDAEDFWVAGRTEPGTRTGILTSMIIGRNEPALQHLHRGFNAELAARRARREGRTARPNAAE